MICATNIKTPIGKIITLWQNQFGTAGPTAQAKVIREATLEEFMNQQHPTSTAEDLEHYKKFPCRYHYEVSVD